MDDVSRLETRKKIGARVRRRRKILGLTQSELGDRAGVRFQQIQKYEAGANEIGAVRLFEIAEALDVDVQYFFADLQTSNGGDEPEPALDEAGVVRAARAIAKLPPRIRERLLTLAEAVTDELQTNGPEGASDGRSPKSERGRRVRDGFKSHMTR